MFWGNRKQKSNYFNSVDLKQPIIKIDQDIIRYSIIRNNNNNKVSQVISVTIGNNNEKIIPNINNDKENKSKIIGFKKTIINVNQYYPNYYINTNNIDKNIDEQTKNKLW